MNEGILTPARVSCEGFETRFRESMKVLEFKSDEFIDEIRVSLKSEKKVPFNGELDVRAKVFLLNNDSVVSVYCLNGGGWFITEKGKYVRNKPFEDLVYGKIRQK